MSFPTIEFAAFFLVVYVLSWLTMPHPRVWRPFILAVSYFFYGWVDPRWIVCVFNNQDLNEVTWEQRVMEGNPKFNASQDIPDFAYARFGEMLGFKGIYVDSPDHLGLAWQESLTSDRPVVIEVKTDPEVVPLPPHLTLKQARGFMSSMKNRRGSWPHHQ